MKRRLIAKAVVAAAGTALAQTTVASYRLVDISPGSVKNGLTTQVQIDSGISNAGRLFEDRA